MMAIVVLEQSDTKINAREPRPDDGYAINQLVSRCPPLDENSLYCNLLQCTHFSASSVLAEIDTEIVGFISGYIKPGQADTVFIWQVAVDEAMRGCGLAKRMLFELLHRPACDNVCFLETTVTPGNKASEALFIRLAQKLNTNCQESILFECEKHFSGRHDSERLFRIGPFSLSDTNSQ